MKPAVPASTASGRKDGTVTDVGTSGTMMVPIGGRANVGIAGQTDVDKRQRKRLADFVQTMSKAPPLEESLRAFVMRNERDRLWESFLHLVEAFNADDPDRLAQQGNVFTRDVKAILERVADLDTVEGLENNSDEPGLQP